MNETMYESMPVVAELNRVEGFEPQSLMRNLGDEQNRKMYLDVLFRKLWFRLKNPSGKICKKIVKLTDQCAVVEARVYLDVNDAEESYVANAFGLRFYSADGDFGPKYLEMAETAAAGRALADAGYGSQFADVGGEYDPVQVDAALPVGGTPTTGGPADETDAGAVPASAAAPAAAAIIPATPPVPSAPAKPVYTMDMDVDKIMELMTLEEAMNLTISAGTYKGKLLGPTAAEKPSCLSWFMNGYKGPDNILRAAAKLLVDSAMKAVG